PGGGAPGDGIGPGAHRRAPLEERQALPEPFAEHRKDVVGVVAVKRNEERVDLGPVDLDGVGGWGSHLTLTQRLDHTAIEGLVIEAQASHAPTRSTRATDG